LRWLRSAEAVRLIAAVIVAAGAVALIESANHGGHKSSSAAAHSGQPTLAGGGTGLAGPAQRSSAGGSGSKADGAVTVAGGPAVERSLQRGSMTVVIDQPPPGLLAQQNQSIAQGAEIAVEQLNAAGGLPGHIRIRLVRQSLDDLSAAALKARLGAEAAAVLVLPCDTDSQLSLAASASEYGMLMLAPCNPDSTAGSRYATYWPVGMSASDEAAGLVSAIGRLGYGSVFVVTAPGPRYLELLTAEFRRAAQAEGVELAGSASIAMTTQDFSGLARAIQAAQPRPSAIFTALPPPLVNHMAAGLLAQGVGQTVIGSTTMDTPLTLSGRSTALENATFASYGFPRESAAAHRFEAEYRKQFGRDPVGGFPGLGLETIRLLQAAVRKAGSAEPAAIQRALSDGITLNGVGLADRTYEPGGNHNPIGEVAITKVASGSFLPLLAVTPKATATP
jgi:branched-chain amino acid transport system substrate-binding protein